MGRPGLREVSGTSGMVFGALAEGDDPPAAVWIRNITRSRGLIVAPVIAVLTSRPAASTAARLRGNTQVPGRTSPETAGEDRNLDRQFCGPLRAGESIFSASPELGGGAGQQNETGESVRLARRVARQYASSPQHVITGMGTRASRPLGELRLWSRLKPSALRRRNKR